MAVGQPHAPRLTCSTDEFVETCYGRSGYDDDKQLNHHPYRIFPPFWPQDDALNRVDICNRSGVISCWQTDIPTHKQTTENNTTLDTPTLPPRPRPWWVFGFAEIGSWIGCSVVSSVIQSVFCTAWNAVVTCHCRLYVHVFSVGFARRLSFTNPLCQL